MNRYMSLHVKLLVSQYGRGEILKALAHIDGIDLATVEREFQSVQASLKEKNKKRNPVNKPNIRKILERTVIPPNVQPLVKHLAYAYESKNFLPELRKVRRFLESHGVEANKIRSRSVALSKIIDVLARQTPEILKELIAESEQDTGSDLAIIADQILGGSTNDKPAENPPPDSPHAMRYRD